MHEVEILSDVKDCFIELTQTDSTGSDTEIMVNVRHIVCAYPLGDKLTVVCLIGSPYRQITAKINYKTFTRKLRNNYSFC